MSHTAEPLRDGSRPSPGADLNKAIIHQHGKHRRAVARLPIGQTEFRLCHSGKMIDVSGGREQGRSHFFSVVGCAPDEVTIGLRVLVCFQRVSDRLTLPCFRPAASA